MSTNQTAAVINLNLPCPCSTCGKTSIKGYCEKRDKGTWLNHYALSWYDLGSSDFLAGVSWEDGTAKVKAETSFGYTPQSSEAALMMWSYGWGFARDYEKERTYVEAIEERMS